MSNKNAIKGPSFWDSLMGRRPVVHEMEKLSTWLDLTAPSPLTDGRDERGRHGRDHIDRSRA